ncbi:MAG: hypothetical protein WCX77_03250, partial [Candidatus Paceibacterota bacterium]
MDKKEICEKIKYAIRKVAIVSNDSVLSFGSGVVINSSGLLLTANHILDEYLALPNVKIIVEGVGKILPSEYKIRLGGPSIDIDTPEFVKPIIIDLAILEP